MDLCNQIKNLIQYPSNMSFINIDSVFKIKILKLAKIISSFKNSNKLKLNEYEKKLHITYSTYKNKKF